MSYDFETGGPLPSERYKGIPPADPTDLEAIVCLLELGAILLTDEPGAEFTAEALIGEAQRLGGDEVPISEVDCRIVLGFIKSIRRTEGDGGGWWLVW